MREQLKLPKYRPDAMPEFGMFRAIVLNRRTGRMVASSGQLFKDAAAAVAHAEITVVSLEEGYVKENPPCWPRRADAPDLSPFGDDDLPPWVIKEGESRYLDDNGPPWNEGATA